MKAFIFASLILMASTSFAVTSIDRCVEDALEGARASLAANENLDPRMLFIEEKGMLINKDAQYLKTRKELETVCRRLYISTVDLAE